MKRIAKKVREEAAMLCAIAASRGHRASIVRGVHDLDASGDAWLLALDAHGHVMRATGGLLVVSLDLHCAEYAEAAQLLWEGWEP